MTMIIKLKIFGYVCLFFLFLSLSARELILSDLYLNKGSFWSISLIFGFLTALLLAIPYFKKGQTGLDRFRVISLMGIAGLFIGPGLFGTLNRMRSVDLVDKEFSVEQVIPLVEGRGIGLSDLESPDAYRLFLETDHGYLKLRMQPSKLISELKKGDQISITVCGGLLGFHFFDNDSLKKI